MYAVDSTGSSATRPLKMYMRVFSITAKSSALSSAHLTSHTSLRSKRTGASSSEAGGT